MKIKFTIIIMLFIAFLLADTNFTVMSYNALNFDGTDRLTDFETVLTAAAPDILICQEIESASGSDAILAILNSVFGGYERAVFVADSGTINNMLYYKTSIATLVSQDVIDTSPRDVSEYVLNIDGNPIRFYSCHLKASTGYEAERLAAITILRDHLNTLSAGTEFVIVGDMNIYTSSEGAYQKFIENEVGNNIGRAEDLCSQVGYWHNNSSFSDVHSQSTRLNSLSDGSSGGMDDKFDFIFANYGMNNNSGIDYIPDSFISFGNDGNHYNQSINNNTNSAVSSGVADALYYASDHLPVCADFVSIGGGSEAPLIVVTPSSLNGFNYVVDNGPSSEQSFTVEGSNLTANVTITSPTNYEISENSGSGYTSSINLNHSGGSVSETTIYVRSKAGLSAGNYNNEDITLSSTDATGKIVTCSGTVTTGETSGLFITELADPNNSDGSRFVELYNSGSSAVDLSTGYDLQRWTNNNASPQSAVELTGTIPAGGFYIVCANQTTFTSTYGFEANQSIGTGGPADSNGDDQLALRDPSDTIIDMFGVAGEDGSGTDHEFEDGRAERKENISIGVAVFNADEWNIDNDSGGGDGAQDAPTGYDPGVWIGTGGNLLPSISNILLDPAGDILASTTVSVSADVSDGDGTISLVELNWGTVSGSLGNTISMSNGDSGDIYTTLTNIPAQALGTTVYYEVYAEDDVPDSSTSSENEYTVIGVTNSTLLYEEPFSTDLGDSYTYSVSGSTKEWYWNSGGYASMNGYNSGDTEEDWFVLPAIDFDSYVDEIMTFDSWYKYGTDNEDNYLELYYSSDYTGLGDPTGSSWAELNFTQPAVAEDWTASGSIDLSGITGSSIYIALKYNYEAGSYRYWSVDDISIYGALNESDSSCDYAGVTQPSLAGFNSMNNSEPAAFDVYKFNISDAGTADMLPISITQITIDVGSTNTAVWTDAIGGAKISTDGLVRAEFNATTITDEAIIFENIPLGTFDVANGTNEIFTLSIWLSDSGNLIETDMISLGIDGLSHGLIADDSGSQFDGTFAIDSFFDITFDIEGDELGFEGFPVNVAPGTPFGGKVKVVDGAGNTDLDGIGTVTLSSTNAPITSATGLVQTLADGEFTWSDLIYPTNGDEFKVRADYSLYSWFVETEIITCAEQAEIIINEVDADTPGNDTHEFLELYDGGVGNTSLTGLVVVLFNGNGDMSYNAIDLDGYSTDSNGYFLIGNDSVLPLPAVILSTNGIQNGADAVALYAGDDAEFPNGTAVTTTNLIDAIVYGTNDSDDAGLLVLLNAGQPQVNDTADESMQRLPNGTGGARNTDTYGVAIPTPGAENVGTVATLEIPTNVVISHDGTTVTITWDAVAGANSYKVSECDTPDGTFAEVTDGTLVGTTWTKAETNSKKFYYVEASTD